MDEKGIWHKTGRAKIVWKPGETETPVPSPIPIPIYEVIRIQFLECLNSYLHFLKKKYSEVVSIGSPHNLKP